MALSDKITPACCIRSSPTLCFVALVRATPFGDLVRGVWIPDEMFGHQLQAVNIIGLEGSGTSPKRKDLSYA